jgi:DNA helicase-2/ATP-dependent DNA helicase PcrA
MKKTPQITAKFTAAYERLNPEQKKAVDAIAGPVMVIAGPGTGKTEVLTMRIANILEHTDTPPEKILALTFTESGVASMRKRLAELIGGPAYRVTITTFHGFANGIIKTYPGRFPEIIGSSNITEVDEIRILRDLIDTLPLKELRPFGDKYYYLKHIQSAINELKKQDVAPAQFGEYAREEKENIENADDLYHAKGAHKGKIKGVYQEALEHNAKNEELAKTYESYERSLRAGHLYDYNDMIMYVARALENDENLKITLQEEYDYLLIDEHQDTNGAQNRIIELLAGPPSEVSEGDAESPNLFLVGDEKQAIYRFQGASLANFEYFKKRYKNVVLISLKNNYRSTQTILDAAQELFPDYPELAAQKRYAETPIALAAMSSPEAEYYFIAEKAKELLARGTAPEEIAILYRENKDAAPIARALLAQNIPVNIESDQDILGDGDIKKLLRILRAVQHFGSPTQFFELLHVDFLGIPPLDIYKLASFAAKKRTSSRTQSGAGMNSYDIARSETLLAEADIEAKEKILELYQKLSDWKRIAENRGAAEAFETIVRDSGFLAYLLGQPAAIEKITKLHALFEHLKSLIENRKSYALRDFFDHLDLLEEHSIAIKSAETLRVPGRIRLMTAHKSKGLEFEYVFIVNAIDGKWGSRRRREHIKLPRRIYDAARIAENKFEKDDDERNLFYVAVTRAKKEIFITWSGTNRDGKEQLQTQFIREIRPELISIYETGSYEKEFAAHREIEFAPAPYGTPELASKKFLSDLFEERGLSVTALNNYLECPWRYFYVNLIRIPEAPNKHLCFGNAIHAALKSFFDRRNSGKDAEKEYLIERFEEALAHEPIEENDYEEALEKGRIALASYYESYHDSWARKTVNELKIDNVVLSPSQVSSNEISEGRPGVKILGKIDKLEILDAKNVAVADYKTGKPKSRNFIEGKTKESGSGDYKRQLVFYQLLLDKGSDYKMSSAEIDFIEPDEKGRQHKELFTVAPEETIELTKTILDAAQEIKELAFWDRTCDDPDCRYCALRKAIRFF